MKDQQGLSDSQNNLTDSTVIIGEVKNVTGKVIAVSENNVQRILHTDDNVFKNDKIKVISGTVHIEFFEGSAFITLGKGDNVLLDESVYLSEPSFIPEAVIDAKSIIAAIDLGADPTKIAPPAAAGPKTTAPPAIEENEGSPGFPVIDRDGNSTIAESGFDTGSFVPPPVTNLVDDEEEIIPNNPEPPVTPPEPPVTPPEPPVTPPEPPVTPPEPPVINSNKFNLPENSVSGTEVGKVDAETSGGGKLTFKFENGSQTSKDGFFTIDAVTGVIALTALGAATNTNGHGLLDFESQPNMDTLQVTVMDEDGNSTTQAVDICITNVNEPPTIDLDSDLTVLEDCIDTSSPIKIGTLSAVDPDGNFDKYIISGEDADLVEVMGNMIQLRPGVMLEVGTINISIVGVDKGSTPLFSNKVDFSVDVIETEKPEIISNKFNLKENSDPGDVVGEIDVKSSSPVTFSFENGSLTSQNGYFSINATTGIISLTKVGAATNDNGLLNFECYPNMDSLWVTVTNQAGKTDTQEVKVCITDVNEPPKIDLDNDLTVLEDCADTSCGIFIGNLSAMDPDGNFDHYEISGDDKNLVEIKGNELRLKPNVILNSDINPEISVSIFGVDKEGLKSNQVDFSVDVIDTNNPITQSDSFYFPSISKGASSYPIVSVIDDFNTCEGDCLNLKDLLIGEENNPIEGYLEISFTNGSTKINVIPEATGDVKQEIILKDVNLSDQYGTADTSAILKNLLSDNNIIVDQ